MSWSYQTSGTFAELPDALPAEAVAACESQNAGSTEAAQAAWDAALDLVGSGLVGVPEKTFGVTISGHHNPDCEPVAGWANDTITVTVAQR